MRKNPKPCMYRRLHPMIALAAVMLLTGCQIFASRPHSATISWTASQSKVIGYNVYRTLLSNGHRQKLNVQPIDATKYVDPSVQNGETYSYAVTSVDDKGIESQFSEPIIVKVPR